MIVQAESGLGRRGLEGMGRTAHNPKGRSWKGMYGPGLGRSAHNPHGGGKNVYGVGGPWGDVLRDIVGDVANTGLDIWRGNEGMPNAGQPPQPVVVVQESSFPWKPVLIVGGVGLGAFLLYRLLKKRR